MESLASNISMLLTNATGMTRRYRDAVVINLCYINIKISMAILYKQFETHDLNIRIYFSNCQTNDKYLKGDFYYD